MLYINRGSIGEDPSWRIELSASTTSWRLLSSDFRDSVGPFVRMSSMNHRTESNKTLNTSIERKFCQNIEFTFVETNTKDLIILGNGVTKNTNRNHTTFKTIWNIKQFKRKPTDIFQYNYFIQWIYMFSTMHTNELEFGNEISYRFLNRSFPLLYLYTENFITWFFWSNWTLTTEWHDK